MKRITMALALAGALAACGGRDEAREAATEAREATEVTVDSAPEPGAPAGQPADEDTQVTVESAEPGEQPVTE